MTADNLFVVAGMLLIVVGMFAARRHHGDSIVSEVPATAEWIGDPQLPHPPTDASVQVIIGSENLRAAYEALRSKPGLLNVRAIWNAEYAEADDYFDREGAWLSENPSVLVERVVHATHLSNEHYQQLLSLQRAHSNLEIFESRIEHIELFLCEYRTAGAIHYRGVLVVNNIQTHRAEVGVLFDGATLNRWDSVLASLREWFLTLKERPIGRRDTERSIWDRSAEHYDEFVRPNPKSPYLGTFLTAEESLLAEAILSLSKPRSILEFGCGTGRTIHSLRTQTWARDAACFVGIDISDAMLRQARQKRGSPQRDGSATKAYFFSLDGRYAQEYLKDGRITLARAFGDTDHLRNHPLDSLAFEESTKVICSLLNTIGILRDDDREVFVRNMFGAAGSGDRILLSVFAAEAFPRYARALYRAIPDIVGIPATEMADSMFDDSSATFTAGNYYSHWFQRDEVNLLVDRAGGVVLECKEIKDDDSVLGCVFVCQTAPVGEG